MQVYVYTPVTATFVSVPHMPHHLPQQIREALIALQQIDTAGIIELLKCFYDSDRPS